MKRVMVLVVGLLLAGFSNTFAAECADYAKGLEKCEKYSCKFTHPFTNTKMEKKILGLVDGKCGTTEEMPNHGMMACHYSEVQRKAVAQYLVKAMTAESVGMKTTIDTATGKAETRHTLDDKAVENPLDKAMNDGTCVISGY
ncbi:MAG: hypothetical protein HY539_00810 [Deltaproteobacteria bacterium]|nr:hypothetical protein [Deltaproteobacteria bacterium]